MLHAVLMAGGSGTRFWPASRRNQPKQLLSFSGPTTMLQATAARLEGLVPTERQLVVTSDPLVKVITAQLPEVRIVGEPCRRDTAPAVGLAAVILHAADPDATMLMMPSDHVITTNEQFAAAVRSGVALLDEDPSRIITFGIPPSYAAESFGYIERGATLAAEGGRAFQVVRFREKPNASTAEQYLQSGQYYWNSGIFLWRTSTILELLRKFEPAMAAHLDAIAEAVDTAAFCEVLRAEFEPMVGKSIDYAVMERHDNVVVIEAPFQWDDVGSWQAIARLNPPDAHGNSAHGLHVGIDTRNSIIHTSPDHAIVTIDIEDLIVVHTPTATLVAPRASEERVREAVKELEARGLNAFL